MKRNVGRALLVVLNGLVLVAVITGIWLRHRTLRSLPVLDGTVSLPGLSAPVQVLRDARGVPHIRATSLADALFAQGYVTGQDRLWQMDLSRRRAEGELSEIFGNRTLRMDIESRTLGLRSVAERALAELSPDERLLLTAYSRGVDAFIEGHRDRLPLEFLILRYQPRPWREIDSVGVALNLAAALSHSWDVDLTREHIAAKLGKDLSSDVFPDHSAYDVPVAEVPAAAGHGTTTGGAAAIKIGGSERRVVRTARAQPALECGSSRYRFPGLIPSLVAPGLRAERGKAVAAASALQGAVETAETAGLGSNNWVVAGTHTQTGKPLLANDPHLGHSVPSIWYMIHIKAPGLDVTGVSLPGLPLVIIGHNRHIAWGMTNTAPDVQDLYIERFSPRDPAKYLHNGQWVGADVRRESIKVRGQRDYALTVLTTRHGPIISHDSHRDLALQWTLLDPHGVKLPFLRLDQAGNWREFTAALHDFTVPMQNFVYADDQGNIGYYAAGLVPIRKQGNGSVPVPGNTDDYDWDGFIPFDSLPHAYNPSSGIIATANGRVVPDNYPYFITARWEAPYRTARIFQLLREGGHFTAFDMLRIQTDIFSLEDKWLAERLLAASATQPAVGADAQFALSAIRNWDGEARADSVATLVLEVTRHSLLARILKPKLGDETPQYHWPMSTTFLQNAIDQNLTRWLPPGDRDFDVTLMKSLEEGVRQIPSMVHSSSHTAWKWGNTIPLIFHHPLDGVPLVGKWLDVGPFPQAGTGTTVKQTTPRLGPSMRMVVDFSDFDQSLQNITLGESGQVFSPYYRDQVSAWYEGKSFPMLFSDAAVDKGAVHKLVLEPRR